MYFLSSYGHSVLFDATCGSEDSAGIGLLLQVLLDDKCSLLRAQSKPLFPELSCTICAELSVVPEHFHLCFTSVYKYTVLKDTPGQTSDGEVEAEPMLSFFKIFPVLFLYYV